MRDGQVVEWNDYYAYGAVRDKWSLADGRWKYLGKELDDETALLHLDAREYDPMVGIFNKPDRFEFLYPSYSPYSYGRNNPMRFYDATGDTAQEIVVTADRDVPSPKVRYLYDIDRKLIGEQIILLSEEDFEKQLGKKDCQETACRMSNKSGKDYGRRKDRSIQMVGELGGGALQKTRRFDEGMTYITNLAHQGVPPIVGVDHTPLEKKKNGVVNDGTTDHYVTIASQKINYRTGETSYRYFDPGTRLGKDLDRVFTRNSDGFYTGPGYTSPKHTSPYTYTLSTVVTSNQLKPRP